MSDCLPVTLQWYRMFLFLSQLSLGLTDRTEYEEFSGQTLDCVVAALNAFNSFFPGLLKKLEFFW